MLAYDFDFTKIYSLISEWSWDELYYGFEKKLISEEDIISFALEQNSAATNQFKPFKDSCYINKRTDIEEKLLMLAKGERKSSEEIIVKKWIYAIILYGYFFNKDNVYEVIEDVYAEFDHPRYLATLVRYMPYDGRESLPDKLEKYIADGKEVWCRKNS